MQHIHVMLHCSLPSIKQLCLTVNALVIQPVLCFPRLSSPQIGQQAWSCWVFERTDHTQAQTRENPQYLGLQRDCAHVTYVVPHLGPKCLRVKRMLQSNGMVVRTELGHYRSRRRSLLVCTGNSLLSLHISQKYVFN